MRKISEERSEECVAIASFIGGDIVRFDNPNDEAIEGHPLYSKGLHAYGIYEVLHSSTVARLEAENKVRFPNSDYSGVRHFIMTFHDSMFEGTGDALTVTISHQSYRETIRMLTEKMVNHISG